MASVIFVETLRGALQEGGAEHAIEVELLAEAPSPAALLRNGCLAVRGVVRAPRWIAEAPVRGSLRIQPYALTYQLFFETRDGRTLELEGLKRPSLLAPVRSMTTLPSVLCTEDPVVVVRGELRFELGKLLPFLLG
jgi:hypothetical protein